MSGILYIKQLNNVTIARIVRILRDGRPSKCASGTEEKGCVSEKSDQLPFP